MATYDVLIMGASYGSLLATKLLFGGHKITMVCLPAEVEAFNSEGARIRMPIRGRKDPIELDSRKLPGKLLAAGPGAVDPAGIADPAISHGDPLRGRSGQPSGARRHPVRARGQRGSADAVE